MGRPFRLIHVAGLLAVLLIAGAKSSEPFVQSSQFDFKSLLAPPPGQDSPQFRDEVSQMLQWQAERTDADVKRIQAEAKMTPFIFSDVLGSWFNAGNLPYTAKFLDQVMKNAASIDRDAKEDFARPRPFLLDSRIQPCVEKDKSYSYPSGHATRSGVVALTLAEMFPEHKDALLAKAWQIGSDRTLGGEHFPSDVVAGRILAKAVFEKMAKNPDFQTDLAKAKAECLAAKPAK